MFAAILICGIAVGFLVLKTGAAAEINAPEQGTQTPFLSPVLTPIPSPSPTAMPAAMVSSSPSLVPTAAPTPTPGAKAPPSQSPTATPKATEKPTAQPSYKPAAESTSLPDILLEKKISVSLQSEQIVVVLASLSKAEVTLYEKSEQGDWEASIKANGSVGKNGVSADRKEGDGSTPMGVYKLGFAFGNKEDPGTKMDYRDVTNNSYWVDDPKSRYYNKWVEGTQNKDWNSAEELWKAQTAYAYALVVEYNYGSKTVPGKGSAIFLHCGSKPTVGCIAIPEDKMKAVLKTLDPQKNPVIVITK